MKNTARRIIMICIITALVALTCIAHADYVPLSKGSKGEAVVELQNRLNELGYSVGTADGDFGGKTEKAIQQFQRDNGLQVTGTLNEATYNVMFLENYGGGEDGSASLNSLYLVHGEDGYGFVNSEGDVLINCVWEEAFPFQEGLSKVKRDGLYGFIDTAGNEVIMCQWNDASDFKEGVASVSFEGENAWGAINTSGDQIIPCEYYHISPCSEGIIVACECEDRGTRDFPYEHHYTAYSLSGKSLFKWDTESTSYKDEYDKRFSEGLLEVSSIKYTSGKHSRTYSEGYVYLNKKGQIEFEMEKGLYTGDFSEGLASATIFDYSGDTTAGFVDTDGDKIIDFSWEWTWSFRNGLAMVRNNQEKYGYIDHSGVEVIPCAYNAVMWFTEGRSAVMNEKEKWGFIDESGNLVIDYQYDEVEQFQGGLALCTVNGEKIYIDKDGNEVFNFEI